MALTVLLSVEVAGFLLGGAWLFTIAGITLRRYARICARRRRRARGRREPGIPARAVGTPVPEEIAA